MTDKLYTQTEGGIRYWTREELLIRAETAEAEVERAEAKAHEFESEAIHNDEIMQSLAAEVAALKARIAELETENIDLISEIVQIDCRDYGRGEYQTQSLANQELIYRLVAAGRMRHKRNDHKDRPIYEFVPAAQEEAPAT